MSTLYEFLRFLMSRKKYWLIPIFVLLFLMGFVLFFSHGTALAPFIYTVF